jgi:hypothetical protein
VSLGGGVRYSDLTLRKSANDLILETGNNDRLTFQDWYAGEENHGVRNLQVITEAMAGYDQASPDSLFDDSVEVFDFQSLTRAFDTARTISPTMHRWAVMDSLLDAHLFGSDGAALGGDLAYQYGLNGTLAGIGVAPVQGTLGSTSFGTEVQALHSSAVLQQEVNRLV